MQPLAPQVEIAVAQADILRIFLVAEHGERQFLRIGLHLDAIGMNLDLAGGEVRIDGVGVAADDLALDRHDGFDAQPFQRLERFVGGVGDDLGQAVMVAQIDEQEVAMVALAVNPAREPDSLADMRGAQLAAIVGAIGMHVRTTFERNICGKSEAERFAPARALCPRDEGVSMRHGC